MHIRGGKMSSDDNSTAVRRCMYSQDMQSDYFREVPRKWLCLDIDGWRLPADLDVIEQRERAIEWAIDHLPAPFKNVTLRWQMSASAGIRNTNLLYCHMWFWLDRAISSREAKRYFGTRQSKEYPIDSALFNAVQIHCTAAPVFIDVDDPFLNNRSGLLHFKKNVVKFPRLPEASLSDVSIPTSHGSKYCTGFESHLDRIGADRDGFHEPIRDAIASLAATSGRRIGWLSAKELIRNATLAAIERAGYGGTYKRIHQWKTHRCIFWTANGRSVERNSERVECFPIYQSLYNHSTIPTMRARAILQKEIRDWLDRKVGNKAIFATAGLGKSREALQAIKNHIGTKILMQLSGTSRRQFLSVRNLLKGTVRER